MLSVILTFLLPWVTITAAYWKFPPEKIFIIMIRLAMNESLMDFLFKMIPSLYPAISIVLLMTKMLLQFLMLTSLLKTMSWMVMLLLSIRFVPFARIGGLAMFKGRMTMNVETPMMFRGVLYVPGPICVK